MSLATRLHPLIRAIVVSICRSLFFCRSTNAVDMLQLCHRASQINHGVRKLHLHRSDNSDDRAQVALALELGLQLSAWRCTEQPNLNQSMSCRPQLM